MLAQALRLNLHVLVFQYLPGLSKDSMCQITCFYWFYYNWYLFKHGLEVKKKKERERSVIIIARPFVDTIKWRNQDIGSYNGRKKENVHTQYLITQFCFLKCQWGRKSACDVIEEYRSINYHYLFWLIYIYIYI